MTTVDEAGAAAQPKHRRGSLRVYLGAAPGVGKTFAMLNEGQRAHDRGVDVVVGFVETYGRTRTAEQLHGLDVLPRAADGGMDVAAVIARHPQRVLVDELAPRWRQVEELLDAGIDVITTVNIHDLESVTDVVERITGVKQHDTVPDDVVRGAEQVQLVDSTPEELRRRMAHGNIYGPEKVDASVANYFRTGNLAALRELALLWLADQVDVGLAQYRERHGITEPWETRERVVVAITGAPGTDALIRRAARIAQRAHGELVGVHVSDGDGRVDAHRSLLEQLGGEFHEVAGSDVAAALVDFAQAENATQLVLGASHRSRWAELIQGSIINRAVRLSGPIDVHVVSHADHSGPWPAVPMHRGALSARRRAVGWAVGAAGVPLLTVVLAHQRGSIGLDTALLLYLALVVGVAAVGGALPALTTAVAAFLCANWFFTPPFHRWSVAEGQHVVALAVFLGVAVVVSRFVDAAARRASDAATARREAQVLARMAATMAERDPLPALLGYVQDVFGLDGAAILDQAEGPWRVTAASGQAPASPDDADFTASLAPGTVLALSGTGIAAADHAVLRAFAAQLAAVVEHGRLRVEAGRAEALAEANALRSALLQAVSHDLRTPLASIKASVTSLRQPDIDWPDTDRDDFLGTIEEEADRLTRLVEHLLDMSRVQAGAVRPVLRPVALEEVVPAAVFGHSVVDAEVAESLPPVLADDALLERALANVVDNAVRFTPPGRRVRVEAGVVAGRVDIRVVDQGPGIPADRREEVFQPFQRLDDGNRGTGVGLGLAVARGFMTAMGGAVDIEDTPGGGTTVVLSLPVAA